MKCPACGKHMVEKVGRFGRFLSCSSYPECDTSVSLDYQGNPMGTPADRDTRELRKRAHRYFDRLWKGGLMSKDTAYSNLRRWLDLTKEDAHIGMFNKDYCMALINKLNHLGLKEPNEPI